MILIKILNIRDWKPLSATHKLDKLLTELEPKQINKLEWDFVNWLLRLYKVRLQEAIKTQRLGTRSFRQRYKPLSKDYVRSKKRKGQKTGMWEATGFLLKSITSWRHRGKYYVIGFKRGIKHPSNPKMDVAKIAIILEKGSQKRNIPPRPLFVPTARMLSKDIFKLFKRFARENRPKLMKYLE
jgi:hypothetical protein